MLYLTPCAGVSPPACGPCGQSCWPRFEIFSVETYNPDYNYFVVENWGDARGSLDPYDSFARLYADNGEPLLVPEPETTFPGPSNESGMIAAQVNLPLDTLIFQGYSPPSGAIGVSFVLDIPVNGTPETLYGGVIREITDSDVILRIYAETLEVAGGRARIKVTLAATMDPWPDGSSFYYTLGTMSSIYFDSGTRNALREALGEAADPCGSMTVQSAGIYFGLSVIADPTLTPPIQVSFYAASVYLGP